MSPVPTPILSLEDELIRLQSGEELKSTFDKVLESCPKFRILVLGRSGVGKSRLVNTVFGIDLAGVQHGRTAGVSDIEQEFTSERNPRLILHDSQGFSHGDAHNLSIVKNFIENRTKKTDLKDRLHAIWLCTKVPTFGGALLEIADETIIKYNDIVPVIVVLTQFDIFVRSIQSPPEDDDDYGDIEEALGYDDDFMAAGSSTAAGDSSLDQSSRLKADEELKERFVKPLIGENVHWVRVSVNYADTLDELVVKTTECIDESLEILFATVQQRNVDLKIKATIDIGKKRYWQGLSTSFRLPGRSLDKWLHVVHNDIIKVWESDPGNLLDLKAATTKVSELQSGLVEERRGLLQNVGVGAVPAIAAIVSGAIPPAAPIAIPIAVGILFAAWVYEAVYMTHGVLRGMMGYIIDLTLIMEGRFLMQTRGDGVTPATNTDRSLFDLSFDQYRRSYGRVHESIREFVTRSRALQSQRVIEEVQKIINNNRKGTT